MLAKVQFDTMTNRETWLGRIEIRNMEGNPIDLSAAVIRLEVKERPYNSSVLSASSSEGSIKGDDKGLIEWEFSEQKMRALKAGFYKVGLVYILQGRTTQVILGDIQIEEGIIT